MREIFDVTGGVDFEKYGDARRNFGSRCSIVLACRRSQKNKKTKEAILFLQHQLYNNKLILDFIFLQILCE